MPLAEPWPELKWGTLVVEVPLVGDDQQHGQRVRRHDLAPFEELRCRQTAGLIAGGL
jgi:hypothetical protein